MFKLCVVISALLCSFVTCYPISVYTDSICSTDALSGSHIMGECFQENNHFMKVVCNGGVPYLQVFNYYLCQVSVSSFRMKNNECTPVSYPIMAAYVSCDSGASVTLIADPLIPYFQTEQFILKNILEGNHPNVYDIDACILVGAHWYTANCVSPATFAFSRYSASGCSSTHGTYNNQPTNTYIEVGEIHRIYVNCADYVTSYGDNNNTPLLTLVGLGMLKFLENGQPSPRVTHGGHNIDIASGMDVTDSLYMIDGSKGCFYMCYFQFQTTSSNVNTYQVLVSFQFEYQTTTSNVSRARYGVSILDNNLYIRFVRNDAYTFYQDISTASFIGSGLLYTGFNYAYMMLMYPNHVEVFVDQTGMFNFDLLHPIAVQDLYVGDVGVHFNLYAVVSSPSSISALGMGSFVYPSTSASNYSMLADGYTVFRDFSILSLTYNSITNATRIRFIQPLVTWTVYNTLSYVFTTFSFSTPYSDVSFLYSTLSSGCSVDKFDKSIYDCPIDLAYAGPNVYIWPVAVNKPYTNSRLTNPFKKKILYLQNGLCKTPIDAYQVLPHVFCEILYGPASSSSSSSSLINMALLQQIGIYIGIAIGSLIGLCIFISFCSSFKRNEIREKEEEEEKNERHTRTYKGFSRIM